MVRDLLMQRKTPIPIQKENMPPKMRGFSAHAAVHNVGEHEMPTNVFTETQFEHDFSRVSVQPSTLGFGQDNSNVFCPFGGACHTCPPRVQAKLKIGQRGDKYEQEADRVSDEVMRMPEPQVQRKGCSSPDCMEEDEYKILQAKSIGSVGAQINHPLFQSVLSSPGQPLDTATCSFMEPRFGQNFSGVRVHTDRKAAESARALNARAYTVGQDVVFDTGEYAPVTHTGKDLLAHELVHVVQQKSGLQELGADSIAATLQISQSEQQISADHHRSGHRSGMFVSHVVVYINTDVIDFHTARGLFRYTLTESEGLNPGEYLSSATIQGDNVDFNLEGHSGSFRFGYRIETDQPNPTDFFSNQSSVIFSISTEQAPEIQDAEAEEEQAPTGTLISIEEAMRRCQSGDLSGIKVFPYRGTRFGGAPLMAHRDGNDIIVKQPVYVLNNDDFRAQTRTLPTETFIGGVRLYANEIVRVHTYEPRWYHLNITGSTSGDVENEFCVTGEQMLQIAEQSTNRTLFNIGLTVVEGATLFIPVGRIATAIGRPIAQAVGRGSRNVVMAAMLALGDVGPTAFAGIASRTPIVLIERQSVNQIASRAVSQSITHTTIQFSERTLAQAGSRVAVEVGEAGVSLGTEVMARTVTVTAVDATGSQVVSTVTTPTGDPALDAMINQAFDATFDMTTRAGSSQAVGQGVTAVAPEVAAGFTQAEVVAFRRFLSKPFSHQDIRVLQQVWDDAARAGDDAILNAGNSRGLFDLHRDRFWTRVRNNPTARAARAIFEAAGCRFDSGAPYYMLNGRRITMTIDHIIERQTAPHLSLTASNLRISFLRENTVVLRLLNQLDPFQ